ncbi:MAG: hypothetical protein FWC73_09755 [Defluviitaleaceae bacterium]|nr:hypothetical protein [Defluviitaleaceae bacterium]
MIRNFFRTEWGKLKVMNFTDKRQYIWEYYKVQIIALILAIAAILYMVNTMILNPPKRDYLYIAWQGNIIHSEPLDELGTRLDVIVEEYKRYQVSIRSYLLTGDPQMDQALITRFFAMMQVGDMHGVMGSSANMLGMAQDGIVKPVHEILVYVEAMNPELHAHLAMRAPIMVFVPEHGEDGTPIMDTMAISLHGAPMLIELGIPSEDLYLSIISNSTHYYELAKALVEMFEGFIFE